MTVLRSFCFAAVALLYITWTHPNLVALDRVLLVAEEGQGADFDGPSSTMPRRELSDEGLLKPSSPSHHSSIPPRILLGIFTTNSPKETNRRKLIRKSYLSHYQILAEANLSSEPTERICSLTDLLDGSTTRGSPTSMDECRIVYTFVMGASNSTTAPTDLTEERQQDNYPYVLDRSGSSDYERDVLYLNIQENMNAGKTATWFKYASSVLPVPAADLGIDLVFKVDSDAVVVPRALLQNLNSELENNYIIQRPARNVYGGITQVRRKGNEVPYMQGGLYFLSSDVAQRITSSECPRADIIKETTLDRGYSRSEDREIGNFVAKCWNDDQPEDNNGQHSPTTIQTVLVNHRTSAAHNRVFKDSAQFRVKWKEFLATDVAFLRRKHIQEKYSSSPRNGCPPTQAATEEEMAWFDRRENMKLAKQRFARFLQASCGPLN
jgi:hypothetical protein